MQWLNSFIEAARDWEFPSATEMVSTTSVDTTVAMVSQFTAEAMAEAVFTVEDTEAVTAEDIRFIEVPGFTHLRSTAATMAEVVTIEAGATLEAATGIITAANVSSEN